MVEKLAPLVKLKLGAVMRAHLLGVSYVCSGILAGVCHDVSPGNACGLHSCMRPPLLQAADSRPKFSINEWPAHPMRSSCEAYIDCSMAQSLIRPWSCAGDVSAAEGGEGEAKNAGAKPMSAVDKATRAKWLKGGRVGCTLSASSIIPSLMQLSCLLC